MRYGGNTSCIEIRSSKGTLLVIDCGTGVRRLGDQLLVESAATGKPATGHVLIGHTHWDHIHGLPFFAPLFQPGGHWSLYGPRGLGTSLVETLGGQMQYSYFPVTLDQLASTVDYHDLVEGTLEIDDVTITTHYLNHPALTLGFRIEVDGWTIVYASDHEPHDPALAAGGDVRASRGDANHLSFVRGADVLIHDAQYLASEYASKQGWGHSTVEYVLDVARYGEVGEVVLHHHEPRRTDDEMDLVLRNAVARAKDAGFEGTVSAAREGEVITRVPRAVDAAARTRKKRGKASRPAIDAFVERAVLDVDREILPIAREAVAAEDLLVVVDPGPTSSLLITDLDAESPAPARDHHGPVVGISRTPRRTADGLTDVIVWPSSVAHVRTKVRAAVLRRACRWEAAALPPDEEQRLAALHELGLLDTEAEERFDRITAMACESLDVPLSLVTFIDADRQWFKSKRGTETPESPRDMSMCAHAILGDDVFVVPDLLLDARFADSPAAVGPEPVRSYAGVPLVLDDGSHIGTLCVADRRPRDFSPEELGELRRLARLVEDELKRGA